MYIYTNRRFSNYLPKHTQIILMAAFQANQVHQLFPFNSVTDDHYPKQNRT